MTAASIVIVGESIAGCTAARELRALDYDGDIVMIGADPDWGYARPPLSKHVLNNDGADATGWDLSALGITETRQRATGLNPDAHTVTLDNGVTVEYRKLIVATGAEARCIAGAEQSGELVIRTLDDARALRARLDTASSAIVVGAGFLGMEIASACVRRGIEVAVVDMDAPLERILGPFLSDEIAARATAAGITVLQPDGPVTLSGSPVDGVVLPDGSSIHADVVVSCVGEKPVTEWLGATGIVTGHGIEIGRDCSTSVADIFAAGDVTCTRGSDGMTRRGPFWSNAVAQGKVAAASALGLPARCEPVDDYFWTEVLGLSIKVVGPLSLEGEPEVLEGSLDDGSALLQWIDPAGRKTVVAYGIRKPVGKLRALARAEQGER